MLLLLLSLIIINFLNSVEYQENLRGSVSKLGTRGTLHMEYQIQIYKQTDRHTGI